MEKILRQLYDGEIHPGEEVYPTDPEYRELRDNSKSCGYSGKVTWIC